MTRTISIVLSAALFMLAASLARAETRLTVHEFYGPEGRSLRGDVENVLMRQAGVTLVPKEQVESTARNLGVDAFSSEGRKIIARELKLSAWVMGVVKKRSGKLHLTVVMYDGADHSRIGRAVMAGRSPEVLRSAVKRELWPQSKDALAGALAPLPEGRGAVAMEGSRAAKVPTPPGAAETQSPTAAEADTSSGSAPAPEASFLYVPPTPQAGAAGPAGDTRADTIPEDTKRKRRPDSLKLFVGVGSPYRSFAYSDPITSTLGDFQLSGVPMFDMGLSYYPAQAFTDGWASWLGIDAAAQVAIGSSTVDRDGNKYKSRYDAYRIGLRGRLPVGNHFVSAFSGYAVNRFSTTPENREVASPNPDVDYRMIRSGVGSELKLPRAIALGADLAWLHVLSVGEIGNWFPRATAGGVELAMYATYALSQRTFTRLTAAYQRHFFDFNSRPGDERSAGGATDQYLTASLAIGVGL